MSSHDLEPDPELTPAQCKLVAELTEVEIKAIDNALLSNTSTRWQKVAMVIAITMHKLPSRVEGIPDVYYSNRVQRLVSDGLLESQGNLSRMRYSEVRRAGSTET